MSELSEIGHKLQAARKRVEKTCSICGTKFQGVFQRNRTTVAYCSRQCRDRAWYVAHGEERKRPTKGEPTNGD